MVSAGAGVGTGSATGGAGADAGGTLSAGGSMLASIARRDLMIDPRNCDLPNSPLKSNEG